MSERRGVVWRGEWQKPANEALAVASANRRAYGSPRDRGTRGAKGDRRSAPPSRSIRCRVAQPGPDRDRSRPPNAANGRPNPDVPVAAVEDPTPRAGVARRSLATSAFNSRVRDSWTAIIVLGWGIMTASLVRCREPGLRFARARGREDPIRLAPNLADGQGRGIGKLADSGGSRGRPAGRQDCRVGRSGQAVRAMRLQTVNPAPEIRERGRARTPGSRCAGSRRWPTLPASPTRGRPSARRSVPAAPSAEASAARRARRPPRWRRRWPRCRR